MTKVISISDDAYEALKAIKDEKESFSKIILKLTEKAKKKPLMAFFGAWPGGKEELNKIEKELIEDRKNFKIREVTF